MTEVVVNGLYKLKDSYFCEFGNSAMMDNKNENRPYYYIFRDTDGIDWAIPLSSQVENYERKIAKEEAKRGEGNCIYYHIGKIGSRKSVFLISDMLPVEPKYILGPFTINKRPYVSKNDNQIRAVRSKAVRYLILLNNGFLKDNLGVLKIKTEILKRRK